MTTDEKRFLRREIIADLLKDGWGDLPHLSLRVRAFEIWYYNQFLNIYSTEG